MHNRYNSRYYNYLSEAFRRCIVVVVIACICRTTAADTSNKLDDPTGYFAPSSIKALFDQKTTFEDYIAYAMRSIALVAGYDNDLHRYDRPQDLIDSFARNKSLGGGGLFNRVPAVVEEDIASRAKWLDLKETDLLNDQTDIYLSENQRNQATCAMQLDALHEASRVLFTNFNTFTQSKQLSLINFIDSFGSAPGTQLLMGNTMWFGSYEQCSQAQVKLPLASGSPKKKTLIEPRYCVASFRSPNWSPQQQQMLAALANNSATRDYGSQSIKLGVCLPAACNSISVLRHAEKIEALVKLVRLSQVPFSDYKLTNLYCLPDESSPLRQLSISARCFLVALSFWTLLVLHFSLTYEWRRLRHLLQGRSVEVFEQMATSKLTQVFAFRLCWRALFGYTVATLKSDTKPSQQQVNLSLVASPQLTLSKYHHNQVVECKSLRELTQIPVVDKQQLAPGAPNHVPATGSSQQKQSLNLNVVDGVKVLSMIWLISAHTMLFLMRTIANGRDFWSILLDARFMTVMAGIFPVDSFFTITGILTAYLKFNKNNGNAMRKWNYWLEAFVHRYMRFMPMYIIIFWYTRDVSEYIGSGPLWDYATAETSLRSMCKRESVLVPLLFQANHKPIEQHCVKPAWYLANDYQYLLITPLYMALIIKSSLLGYAAIALSVLLSVGAQFMTVFYAQDFIDFEGLINFKPMFAAYVLKNLWRLYVMPYNRIGPYLIGIFTGHLIYSNKRPNRVEQSVKSNSKESLVSTGDLSNSCDTTSTATTTATTTTSQQSRPICLEPYKGCIKLVLPLILLISIIYLPLTTKYVAYKGFSAKIGASFLIAMMRLVWSMAVARLIYVCVIDQTSGGFIARFLSSDKWKPMSRIGLSVLLIQWEVIGYFAQTQSNVPYMSIGYLLAAILICTIATYAIGLLIYLTIEYPLSQIEHLYIHPKLFPDKS